VTPDPQAIRSLPTTARGQNKDVVIIGMTDSFGVDAERWTYQREASEGLDICASAWRRSPVSAINVAICRFVDGGADVHHVRLPPPLGPRLARCLTGTAWSRGRMGRNALEAL
jgi:hypothetical protein